ncbi:MAG: hypothetical protein HY673_18560 [Chloroflexi bacterium]|nr:hypothetical protein [Chloroflexota bacterium]
MLALGYPDQPAVHITNAAHLVSVLALVEPFLTFHLSFCIFSFGVTAKSHFTGKTGGKSDSKNGPKFPLLTFLQ